MTVDEANEIRRLVRMAFAARGREVEVFAGHMRDDSGAEFGLWNVASVCHHDREGRRAWPRIIDEHVRKITEGANADPFSGLTEAEVMSRVYPQILRSDTLPHWNRYTYVRDMAPGLKEVLALDCPETVSFLSDTETERYGGAADLRRAGLANLRALPVEKVKSLRAPDGSGFTIVYGRSHYTASRALIMPHLMSLIGDPGDLSHGVLVGMPLRHQVAVHPVRDASVIPSLRHMTRFAAVGYQDGIGRISPQVYWWQDGRWEQLTSINGNKVTIRASAAFSRVLEEVTGKGSGQYGPS